jgi:hypothetical protein
MASDDDDIFDTATSVYLDMDDLDGRLLLIWALGAKEMQGTNGPYTAIEARYVVLDGEPIEVKAPAIPHLVTDGMFSAGQFVTKLKHRVHGRPLLGRVDSRPSQQNKKVLAYGLREPTAEDMVLARTWVKDNPEPDKFDPFA